MYPVKLILGSVLCALVASMPEQLNEDNFVRIARSPHLLKKHHQGLLGNLFGGGNSGYGQGEYHQPQQQHYNPPQEHHNQHGSEGGSFAASAAGTSGHGQSQSASIAFGQFAASISQSQSNGGGKSHDYFDY